MCLGAQLYSLGVNYTLYLSNGYVIGAKGNTKPLTDYYFVYGVVPGEEDPFSGVSEKVGLVKYDASTEIVTLAASQIGDEDEFEELWATRTATGSSYKFKAAPDQTKLYTAVVDTASPVIAGVDENDAAASFKTDANTVFIVRSGATRAFAAYTGVNNMPKFDKDDIADLNDGKGALAVAYSRLGTAALVFLDFGEISASNTNAKPIFILSEKYKATELDGTTPIYLYDAIGTTGEIITIKTRDAALASGLIIPSYDSKGYLVADESEAATAENPAVILDGRVDKNGGHEVWKNRYITYRNSVLTTAYNNELGAESQSYTVAPDCTLYYYKSGKVTVYTDISQIDGVWGNLALVGLDENNQRVTTIYYYAQSKPTNI